MKKILNCFITAVSLLPFSNLCQAQAPALGSTSSFVLFTTTGAVGNTGITSMTGDVGTNSGAITGFGNVNGNMQTVNLVTAQCAADLLIAYNQLNSTIPTLFPGTLLGNGDTLTPGIYQSPAATVLSGELTLDAQGDANAVFIFRIEGPLSTAFATKTRLINGTQACNVFWKVEGVVSMASATSFKGTLIANNAAINMSPDDSLEGRMFSTTGAINVNGIHAYVPVGCGSTMLVGPASPNLGSVACFAIFSSNGAVTNAGITYAAGDIGTQVGLTTGFNQLFVTGTVHPIPDGATAAAAADLVNVYTYLNTLPTDIELLFPAQFGNNLVLTPHTYHLGAATALTGTVYLDARDNPDAVFVIKINGALSTSTFAKVILMNGAQAQNVYWNVDGAVSIADYSVFNGTIIANNGAISLSTGDTINGRVLTTTGALNTAAVYVTSPVICAPLPVSWLYFNGQSVQNNIVLEWATADELNNSFFTLEKSADGTNYSELAQVKAASLQQVGKNAYTYTDQKPAQLNYYRISQTDADGRKQFYKTIQVNQQAAHQLQVTHSIQNSTIVLATSGELKGSGRIDLYSVEGKLISSQKIELLQGQATYTINAPATKGIYLIHLSNEYQSLYNNKILVY